MKRHLLTFLTFGLLAALLALPAAAQENEEGSLEGQIVAGAQITSDDEDSHKFTEYREVPDGFVLSSFSLLWKPSDRWFLDVSIVDAAQDDQRASIVFGQDKIWNLHFTWNENPRRFQDGAVSLYGISGNYFSLPDDLQTDVQAAPTGSSDTVGTKSWLIRDALLGASDIYLGYQRRTGAFGFDITPNRNWRFSFDTQQESREGTMPQSVFIGSSPGGSGSEIASPVDFDTTFTTASAEYIHQYFSVGASMTWSDFDNRWDYFVWDNILRISDATNAPIYGRMANWPNSDYDQLRLWVSANLPVWNTRLWLSGSWGDTTQNDPFLPLTINTAINQGTTRDFNGDGVIDAADDPELLSALPELSLNGRYDTDTMEFRVTTQPIDWLRLKGWWRTYERDDRSSEFVLEGGYVAGDSGLSGTCSNAAAALGACVQDPVLLGNTPIQRARVPFDFKTTRYGIDARFGHFGPFVFSAAWERENIRRNHGAVEHAHENTFKLTADFDGPEWLFLRATWKDMDRNADEYHAHYWEESFPIGEPYIAAFNPGIRRYYQTDRDRRQWSLLLNITPIEWFSFYGEAGYVRNRYSDPETGLAIGSSHLEDISNYCEGGGNCSDPVLETVLLAGRIFDSNRNWTLGMTYDHPSGRFSAWTDYTWENFKYAMASRYRGIVANQGTDDPDDDWGSSEHDRNRTWTVGFDSELLKDKVYLNGTWSRSSSRGIIENWYAAGGVASGDGGGLLVSPLLHSQLTIANLACEWKARKNLSFEFRWWYESWDETDFASDFTQPYMGNDDMDTGSRLWFFLGGEMEDYDVNVFQFLVKVSL